jgi:hypothetical protein
MSDVKDDKSDLTGQVEDSNGTIQELINEDEPNVSNDETIDENEKSQNQVELSLDEENNAQENKEEKIQLTIHNSPIERDAH